MTESLKVTKVIISVITYHFKVGLLIFYLNSRMESETLR